MYKKWLSIDPSSLPPKHIQDLKVVWEAAAALDIREVFGDKWYLVQSVVHDMEGDNHNLDVVEKTCTCGRWQEFRYPCKHAVAYLKRGEKGIKTLEELLVSQEVSEKYRVLHNLYNVNFVVIPLVSVQADGKPVPPENARLAGCSFCGEEGHNKTTCKWKNLKDDKNYK